MADLDVVTNPIKFREMFLAQVTSSDVDKEHGAVLRVLLYYIWRGIFEARAALLKSHAQTDLGILCLATYKSFLPIIQNIRLGYPADTIILLRALMERIALLGYLHAHHDIIPKYIASRDNLQKNAMAWAKEHAPENWMRLYNAFSNVAHSRLEGTAGYMLDTNPIAEAFRKSMPASTIQITTITDELIALVCYALVAVDPFATGALGYENIGMFPADKQVIKYVALADLVKFQNFLTQLINKFQKVNGAVTGNGSPTPA
jgi:hypothetical protein